MGIVAATWPEIDIPVHNSFSIYLEVGLHDEIHGMFGGIFGEGICPLEPLFFAHTDYVPTAADFNGKDSFVINNTTYSHIELYKGIICSQYKRSNMSRTDADSLKKRQIRQ